MHQQKQMNNEMKIPKTILTTFKSFRLTGKIIFPRSLQALIETEHIRAEQSLGCVGQRTGISRIGKQIHFCLFRS